MRGRCPEAGAGMRPAAAPLADDAVSQTLPAPVRRRLLQIAPSRLENAERDQRRGLGPQHPRPETQPRETRGPGVLDLPGRKAAFGTDQKAHRLPGRGRREIGERSTGVGREDDLRAGLRTRQPCFERLDPGHVRNPRAARLLRRVHRDCAPVGNPAFGARRVELHDGAFAQNGMDRPHPELGGLPDDEIHPIALADPLAELDRESRLSIHRPVCADGDLHRAAGCEGDGRLVLVAVSVEDGDRIAGPEPQHLPQVMARGLRQRDLLAGGEGEVDVQAWVSHRRRAVLSVLPVEVDGDRASGVHDTEAPLGARASRPLRHMAGLRRRTSGPRLRAGRPRSQGSDITESIAGRRTILRRFVEDFMGKSPIANLDQSGILSSTGRLVRLVRCRPARRGKRTPAKSAIRKSAIRETAMKHFFAGVSLVVISLSVATGHAVEVTATGHVNRAVIDDFEPSGQIVAADPYPDPTPCAPWPWCWFDVDVPPWKEYPNPMRWFGTVGVEGNQGAELGWSAEWVSITPLPVPLPPPPPCPFPECPFPPCPDCPPMVSQVRVSQVGPIEVLRLWKQGETSDGSHWSLWGDGSHWGLGIGHDVSSTVGLPVYGQAPLNAFIDPTTPGRAWRGPSMW